MVAEIEHVVVLALENRSFDHMLGFVEHPDPRFDGLLDGGPYTNLAAGNGETVPATPDAKRVLPIDPDHSHQAMLEQLDGNAGFVRSYEKRGRGKPPGAWSGLLGPVVNLIARLRHGRGPGGEKIKGRGPLIMRCQPPEHVAVLGTLATQFGTFSRWFCSVPGETWPNRNFLHAATSDGDTEIQPRFYTNKTIFEVLERAGAGWHVYFDDIPQVMAFIELWTRPQRLANWYAMDEFARHVEDGTLPAYSFIEPNHRPPVRLAAGHPSNSQHPGNALVPDGEYDAFQDDGTGDFARAETLLAHVYEVLRAHREVFDKTVLLITYDENGGFYDHVPAERGVANPGTDPNPLTGFVRFLLHRKGKAFDFTMTGGRVPAVVVSPFVPPGSIGTETRDHASVPATLRALFAPAAEPLTARDAAAARFDTLLTLPEPRRDLPDLSEHTAQPTTPLAAPAGATQEVPEHYEPYVQLADKVTETLSQVNLASVSDRPSRERADQLRTAFLNAAKLARTEI
ncbi:alkaline phosphatase family protein [Spirillospora sp. NPDC048911]|uniref:alkaline phosphatase family protein n=1 Tax=Spirillospora sp. NPDC048911 TaxID=3364527 RepID=UPI0037150978